MNGAVLYLIVSTQYRIGIGYLNRVKSKWRLEKELTSIKMS